ncbi:MAG: NAD(P)/FAD-dependent oxidoreductase [Flavobacteriales bacterium]|nr:NAD(P)/FAD-dependent oxidoreductase [Flavobacteriales bacterium]
MKNHQIVIIGGGTAGITVAAQLMRKKKDLDVAIIEPSEKYYYQPAWTLVGAGTYDMKKTERDEAGLIPPGVTRIKEYAGDIDADNNKVVLRSGEEVQYEFLVVAPGIQVDLDGIEGLQETMGKNNVCSNYVDPEYTWDILKNWKGGTALFTQPATPIKCGGAPMKIIFLAAHYMRKHNLHKNSDIIFASPGSVIFRVKEFAITLEKVVECYDIDTRFHHKLVKIDGEKKVATYEVVKYDNTGCMVLTNTGEPVTSVEELEFDMLHLAPPQSAPDFVKRSKIAHQDGASKGWANVDIHSLQNPNYENVFALGDSAALPTAKTGAVVRKQAPVVVDNILNMLEGRHAHNLGYTGYSSCPLVNAYGRMVLAEFGYENKRMSDPMISTFVDTTKEKWSMWMLKKYGLPFMYWDLMLKGKA